MSDTVSSRCDITNSRKKVKKESEWKRNQTKLLKNEGKTYESHSGETVDEKKYKSVTSCCIHKCYETVTDQEEKFNQFWGFADYNKQNVMLSSFLKFRDPEHQGTDNKKNRLVVWSYWLLTGEKMYQVCQKFILQLFQIGKKRINKLQKNILNKESTDDGRGKHLNHTLKLNEDLKLLIRLHCESLPHRQSHYSYESTSLKYFDNPTLNVSVMYSLFLDYYVSVTDKLDVPLGESAYIKYFNRHSGFTFQMPRTDVCNLCYESETSGVMNDDIRKHKEKAADYFKKKKEMLSQENSLSLEFDFAQNLPLPKIPVSQQFLCRLMWLYVFNVHVHNSDESYMFVIPEGDVKKGANTVCNFHLHVIEKEFNANIHKKINLFSDACGGQNRNYMVMRFLSSLSTKLNVEIDYLYPVRGHSFNQCDRNFGTYTQKKKRMERIETKDEYIKLIQSARNPPFTVVEGNEVEFKDYESTFHKDVKGLKISKFFFKQYYPNGTVNVYENYYGSSKLYKIEPKIIFDEIASSIPLVSPPGITEAKIKDVKSLLKYLKPDNKIYYTEHFEKVGCKEIKVEIVKKENIKVEKLTKEKKVQPKKTPVEKKEKKINRKRKTTTEDLKKKVKVLKVTDVNKKNNVKEKLKASSQKTKNTKKK